MNSAINNRSRNALKQNFNNNRYKMLWLQLICLLLVLQSFNAKQVKKEEHEPKIDYCATKCGKHHIACNNNGKPGQHCPDNLKAVDLDTSVKNLILHLHNERRNEVAGGNAKHLAPATRMAHMEWDHELAHLAQLKSLRCSMSEDHCFSTSKFEHPGQNLALLEYHANETDKQEMKHLVENRIKSWLSANGLCKTDLHHKQVGVHDCRFSLAVLEKNNFIGCGAVHFMQSPKSYFHMVCNYAHAIRHGEPIYRKGDTGSECKTGKHKKYKHLCSDKETYE